MESIQPFDLVVFLGLFAAFIVGYAQGITRRLLGTAAILFSLIVAAQLRPPIGGYLAEQWTTTPPEYSYMVAFGAVFVAGAVALSIGIQLSYRSSPLLTRYPVLDEILGGVIGVVEGIIILMAILIIMDPYYKNAGQTASAAEFGPFRSFHDFLNNSLSARILRENVIPGVMGLFGWLFPKDVVDTFTAAVAARI